MTKVIKLVRPNIREWTSGYGPMKSVDGQFDDGDGWTINCKPGNEAKVKADLEALVGKPLDGYTAEPSMDKNTGKQREYQGKLQWTLKAAQQQARGGFGGGGGRGGYVESYRQSKECHQLEQESIQRSVALQQAVAWNATKKIATDEIVLETAARFLEFLRQPPPQSGIVGNVFADFIAAIKAANAERKSNGLSPADSTTVAEAISLRGWKATFRAWGELHESLGDAKLKQLTKAIDLAPCNFEKETTREETA